MHFRISIELLYLLLDTLIVQLARRTDFNWYKKYANSMRPRISHILSFKIFNCINKFFVMQKKYFLLLLSVLPPVLSLKIIYLIIKMKAYCVIFNKNSLKN